MHDCKLCGLACDCDGEDHDQPQPENCRHLRADGGCDDDLSDVEDGYEDLEEDEA